MVDGLDTPMAKPFVQGRSQRAEKDRCGDADGSCGAAEVGANLDEAGPAVVVIRLHLNFVQRETKR
jgi:hypothetical protein